MRHYDKNAVSIVVIGLGVKIYLRNPFRTFRRFVYPNIDFRRFAH
jgi:hypothetical protein